MHREADVFFFEESRGASNLLKKEPKEFKQQYRLTKKERENNITEQGAN